jgi:hypothetical protein
MKRVIKKVKKGEAPTLLEAEKANELIDAINMLLKMEIRTKPSGAGEVIMGKNKLTLVVPYFDPNNLPKTQLTYCHKNKQKTKVFLNPPTETTDDGFTNPEDLPEINSEDDLISFL